MALRLPGFWKLFGGNVRILGGLRLGSGTVMNLAAAGVPTDGTSGTAAGLAGPGSTYTDSTNGQVYRNGGTLASPAWVAISGLITEELTFTETSGAGTYTGSIAVPAGATIVDILVHCVALWNASGACTLKVGDVADDDGIFTGIDLKATDLIAAESLSLYQAGGKQGADLGDAATPGTQMSRRYLATARVISGIVSAAGTAGTTGRTRLTVVYSLPKVTAATKV